MQSLGYAWRLVALLVMSALAAPAASDPMLPPPIGPEAPAVEPLKGEDGLYHQSWFVTSFLDLRDDATEAHAAGKRFAVIFEQRGCIYCTRMHTKVLAQRYINDYVRENFAIVQLDIWGAREVTDFDGARLPEKKLAERWGVLFTPTIVFFKRDLASHAGQWGPPLEVARMSLGVEPDTFYDLFVWVRTKTYERDANFQRFHVQRHNEREVLHAGPARSQ